MKRIVSFCVFGSDPIYQVGALANAELAHEHYPGWVPRFYVSSELPGEFPTRLRALGAEVVVRAPQPRTQEMLWRLRPANERGLDALIVRDTDSRLGAREAAAVRAWLDSSHGFHIMRDHPEHRCPVLGGMWGCRGGVLPNVTMLELLWRLLHRSKGSRAHTRRSADQLFLREMIYPLVRGDALVHSDLVHFEGETPHPFPDARLGTEFVGQIIHADGSTVESHTELLKTAQAQRLPRATAPRLVRWIAALRGRSRRPRSLPDVGTPRLD